MCGKPKTEGVWQGTVFGPMLFRGCQRFARKQVGEAGSTRAAALPGEAARVVWKVSPVPGNTTHAPSDIGGMPGNPSQWLHLTLTPAVA